MKIDRQFMAKLAPFAIPFVAAAAGLQSKAWSDVVLELMFPVRKTYGGLAVPLRTLPRPSQSQPVAGTPSSESLLLIQQSNQEMAKLDILSADITGRENLAGGASCDPPPRMVPLTDTAAGSSRLMRIELPQKTLLTVLVADPAQGNHIAPAKRFTYQDGTIRKEFVGDLDIHTASETMRMAIVAAMFVLAAWGSGYALGRHDVTYPPGPEQTAATPAPAEADED